MNVVIDTNVLVSAFWSRDGSPAKIITSMQNGVFTPCFDNRILTEYRAVLLRPKFNFNNWEVTAILEQIINNGLSITATPLDINFIDESDKKFYEVAKQCGALLVTGNLKHFPEDKNILSVKQMLKYIYYEQKSSLIA